MMHRAVSRNIVGTNEGRYKSSHYNSSLLLTAYTFCVTPSTGTRIFTVTYKRDATLIWESNFVSPFYNAMLSIDANDKRDGARPSRCQSSKERALRRVIQAVRAAVFKSLRTSCGSARSR